MSSQSAQQSQDPSTFSFPAIFEGRGKIVTINRNGGRFGVFINEDLLAQLKLETERHHWFVACGELNDSDLVKEIGDRIEARYY
jgi:hypothetical protein